MGARRNQVIVRKGGTGKKRSQFGFKNNTEARDGVIGGKTETSAPLNKSDQKRVWLNNPVADAPATPLTDSEPKPGRARKPKRVLSDEERDERKVENKILMVLGAVTGATAVASAALYMGPETAVTLPAFMLLSTVATASTISTVFMSIVTPIQRRARRLMDEDFAEHEVKMQAIADRHRRS